MVLQSPRSRPRDANRRRKYANDLPANEMSGSFCHAGEKQGWGGNVGHVNMRWRRWKILVEKWWL